MSPKIKDYINKCVYERTNAKFNSMEDLNNDLKKFNILASTVWVFFMLVVIFMTYTIGLPDVINPLYSHLNNVVAFVLLLVVSIITYKIKDNMVTNKEIKIYSLKCSFVSIEPIREELDAMKVINPEQTTMTIGSLNRLLQ